MHSLYSLALLAYTLTNSCAGQTFCQEATNLNTLDSDQSFHYSPFIMPTPTCSRELEKRRKEEEVMAAATCRRRKKQW
jgi:hypothetical protein